MLTTLVILAVLTGDGAEATTEVRTAARAHEVARVQAHLAGAEAMVRAADTGDLTPLQRARRARLLDELARYRERGVFPRNLRRAGQTPVFIDGDGVRCAMAHLIEVNGGAALVARVAASRNHAYVAELAEDPVLQAWLTEHGLSVEEAARIQPAYPQEYGRFCGGNHYCSTGTCVPVSEPYPHGFCSDTCDPASPGSCRSGMQDAPMVCEVQAGGAPLCVYPGTTPGMPGWPCRLDSEERQCLTPCLVADGQLEGVCARTCSDDAACPEGETCQVQGGDVGAVCAPPPAPPIEAGCHAAGGGQRLPQGALVALAVGMRVRRRRPRT